MDGCNVSQKPEVYFEDYEYAIWYFLIQGDSACEVSIKPQQMSALVSQNLFEQRHTYKEGAYIVGKRTT